MSLPKKYMAIVLRAAARRYPLYSGCGRIAASRPFVAATGSDATPQWSRLRSGPFILTPRNDWVGRALYYFGDLDRKLSWIFQRLLQPGHTVLDVGANIGCMSLVARQLVGPTGTVHAFEPQPGLVSLLRESAKRNGFSNLHVHGLALGAANQTLELAIPAGNLGAASFARVMPPYQSVRKIAVPVHNASEYFESLNLDRIRLMKMDVEGFEAEVIRGAMDYFAGNRPDVIVSEMNDQAGSFHHQPVVQLLQRLDYRFFSIPKALFRVRLRPIDAGAEKYSHDILAVSAARLPEIGAALGSV